VQVVAQRRSRQAHSIEHSFFRNVISECSIGIARLAIYYEPRAC
jgi:hypothetical protein